MAYTTFGSIRSDSNLGLIQQSVVVEPAQPKKKIIEVPGADGSIDLTEALGRVRYYNRKITWTFALYPGADWESKQREVSNALNGNKFSIGLSDDPTHFFVGRVSVTKYNRNKMLHQIVVEADCDPYAYVMTETSYSRTLTSSYQSLSCSVLRMPVAPIFTSTGDATVKFANVEYSIRANHSGTIYGIEFVPNTVNSISVKGTGSFTIRFRNGEL